MIVKAHIGKWWVDGIIYYHVKSVDFEYNGNSFINFTPNEDNSLEEIIAAIKEKCNSLYREDPNDYSKFEFDIYRFHNDYRFRFKDVEDEDYFLLWSSGGDSLQLTI
jgi:hypothetical protein